MADQPQQTELTDTTKPVGIGGWLLLPAIGVFLSPFYIGWRAIRNAGTAAAIMGEDVSWLSRIFVLIEFAVTIAMLAASLYLIYLLISRKRSFPKFFTAFLLGGIVMAIVGLATTLAVLGSEVEVMLYPVDLSDLRGLLGAVLWAAVWIPYTWQSQRVRETFVKT